MNGSLIGKGRCVNLMIKGFNLFINFIYLLSFSLKLLKQFSLSELCMEMFTACGVSGVLYYLLMLVGCNPCYSCFYRKKLRAKFNLEEDPCGDFLVHCFCEPCALCQEYKELKNKGLDPALGNVFRYG